MTRAPYKVLAAYLKRRCTPFNRPCPWANRNGILTAEDSCVRAPPAVLTVHGMRCDAKSLSVMRHWYAWRIESSVKTVSESTVSAAGETYSRRRQFPGEAEED